MNSYRCDIFNAIECPVCNCGYRLSVIFAGDNYFGVCSIANAVYCIGFTCVYECVCKVFGVVVIAFGAFVAVHNMLVSNSGISALVALSIAFIIVNVLVKLSYVFAVVAVGVARIIKNVRSSS